MSEMIENPEDYFRQFVPERRQVFTLMEEEAAKEDIPIVGPVVGELLYILVRAIKARRVLELGTATGYSALYMGFALDVDGRLTSLESDPALADRARERIRQAGLEERVEVITGDAVAIMSNMKENFDFLFLDIEKADYLKVLPQCRRVLRSGGVMVADNTGFADADRFNRGIYIDPGWKVVNLFSFLPGHSPERDGLCIALRR
ncbi:MAG: O-methyltransferase [Pseudomonadota bacterium]